MQGKLIYEFGPFRLDVHRRRLSREGELVSLSPQLFTLLLSLLENHGQLVTKEELRDKIWNNAHVSEHALKVIVGNLRKILCESQNGERYIENVRGKGYCFVASVDRIIEQPPVQAEAPQQKEPESSAPAPSQIEKLARIERARFVIRATVIFVGVAALSVAGYYWLRSKREVQEKRGLSLSEQFNDESLGKSLAVLGFKNLSRDERKEWLDVALIEMFSTELAAGEGFRVIPPDRVTRAKIELALIDAEDATPNQLASIRKNLNVDLVVVGAYTVVPTPHGGEIRLDVRIQDTRTGEARVWKSFVGRENDLFGFISEAGRQLRNDLGLTDLTPEQAAGLRILFPSHPRAAELYAEGLNKLRFSDSLQARSILERALKVQSDHPLIHAALANALSNLGYETLSQQEGKLAVSLARDLPLEQRMSVEGQYRSSAREWDKAIQAYETLFKYLPEQLDYGLQLARAQVSAGKSRDALATIAALRSDRKLPDDGRIDLAEAYAALPLAELRQAQKAAKIAQNKAANRGAQFLVAEALLVEADADRNLGEIPDAVRALEKARQIYTTIDDKTGIGRTLVIQGSTIRDVAPLLSRKQMYEEAIAIFKEIGDQSDKARALNALGGVYEDMGDLEKSKSTYEQSLAIRRETGEDGWAAVTINNIGTLFGVQGDLRHAKEKYGEALAISRRLGGKAGIALFTANIAEILRREGDFDTAKSKFEESLSLYRELGSKASVAAVLVNLGDINMATGNLAGALDHYKEALAISDSVNNKVLRAGILVKLALLYSEQAKVAEAHHFYDQALSEVRDVGSSTVNSEMDLAGAQLVLTEGRFDDAENKSRVAAAEFRKQFKRDSLLKTDDVTVQSLLGQKQCLSAKQEALEGRVRAAKTQDLEIRLSFQVTDWRVRAECDHSFTRAKTAISAALSEAEKRHLFRISLYARMALIELAALEGNLDEASSMIEKTSNDAVSRGFLQSASRVAAFRPKLH